MQPDAIGVSNPRIHKQDLMVALAKRVANPILTIKIDVAKIFQPTLPAQVQKWLAQILPGIVDLEPLVREGKFRGSHQRHLWNKLGL